MSAEAIRGATDPLVQATMAAVSEAGAAERPLAPLSWVDQENVNHPNSYLVTRQMLAAALERGSISVDDRNLAGTGLAGHRRAA